MLLRLLRKLVLQQSVLWHAEVVGGRVDGPLRAEAAFCRVLWPCSREPGVIGRV